MSQPAMSSTKPLASASVPSAKSGSAIRSSGSSFVASPCAPWLALTRVADVVEDVESAVAVRVIGVRHCRASAHGQGAAIRDRRGQAVVRDRQLALVQVDLGAQARAVPLDAGVEDGDDGVRTA